MAINKNPGPLLDSEIVGAVDVVPPEFRANGAVMVTTQEVPVDVGPDDVNVDPLFLESRVIQTRTDERKKTNTKLTNETNVLISRVRLRDGQIGTRTRSLLPVGALLPSDALTEEASQRNLGNGLLEQDVLESPANFSAGSYETRIPDVVPEEFRVLVPTKTTEETSIGQANTNPALGVAELQRRETNVDIWKRRISLTSRAAVTLPAVLTDTLLEGLRGDHSEFNSTVSRVKTLDNGQQSIDTGLLYLKSSVRNLGNGQSLRESDLIDAFPTLTDNLIDRRTGIISNKVKSIVATGTACPAGSEQLALDKFHLLRSTETVDAGSLAAVSWKFVGNTSVDVPPQLLSVTAYASNNAGAGNYSESGSYALPTHGSGGVALKGHCQGSASAAVEVDYVVKQAWGNNVPCTHILFFANATDSRGTLLSRIGTIFGAGVSDWPKFVPQAVVIVSVGGKITIGLELSAVAHDVTIADYNGVVRQAASARTSGGGTSIDVGSSTRSTRIPPTIHPALSVGGSTSTSNSFASSSSISTGANSSVGSISGSASASVSNVSISGTPGQQTIPTSGNYVHRITSEPYLPGTIMVHAEVVNFADFVA